jgi:hypothetical protein
MIDIWETNTTSENDKELEMVRTKPVRENFGSRFLASRFCRVTGVAISLCTVAWLAMSSSSRAEVVIFDGFEDADRDNDGTTDGGSVVDAGDVGIPWYSVNGLIGFTEFHKPVFSIRDDPSPGFGTGNALVVNPFGDNADWAGFFPERITLGPNVGDQLVVSFDMHHDALLLNPGGNTTTLRFGLWQDTDNQLGMASLDGRDTTPGDPDETKPTVWGGSDGYFENAAFVVNGSAIGTVGDYGIWGRIQSGTSDIATQANRYSLGEEINANISTGGNFDNELIAVADGLNGNALFSDMTPVDNMPHTISLSLERVAPDATGQDVQIEVAVDGMAYGAQPPNPVAGMPENGSIETLDSFDYFMLVQNTDAGDYLIDNFKVELIAAVSPGLPGDYNDDGTVGAADYTVWRDGGSPDDSQAGYDLWKANFGDTTGDGGAAASVPEPASFAMAIVASCCACVGYRLLALSIFRII